MIHVLGCMLTIFVMWYLQTEVIVASSEVDDITTNNQVDCTIDMLIAAASQQSTVSILSNVYHNIVGKFGGRKV